MNSLRWSKAVLMMCLVSSGNTALAVVRDAVYNHAPLNRIDTVVTAGGITDYDYDRSSLKTKVSYPNGSSQVGWARLMCPRGTNACNDEMN
jgi:hypothetical protein